MNFAASGFANVEEMVAAMSVSEDNQLAAMGSFLATSKLHRYLQAKDWTSFARRYNGASYAINQYDKRLQGEYQKYSAAGTPNLDVRAAQLYLTYLGFHPGPIDGVAGTLTLSALADFQQQKGLDPSSSIDADTVTQLITALPA